MYSNRETLLAKEVKDAGIQVGSEIDSYDLYYVEAYFLRMSILLRTELLRIMLSRPLFSLNFKPSSAYYKSYEFITLPNVYDDDSLSRLAQNSQREQSSVASCLEPVAVGKRLLPETFTLSVQNYRFGTVPPGVCKTLYHPASVA